NRELTTIDALGAGPLADPPPLVSWPQRSTRASIASGVDLVVLRGDGLVGGPSCGLLIGSNKVIGRLRADPLFTAWQLEPSRRAALVATVECHENPTSGIDAIPIMQCLTVSMENLRNRAERLAPQLSKAHGIGSAIAIETRSPISAILPNGIPSYGI